MKRFFSSCIKSIIYGICFGIGIIGTAAVAVTVSATFTDGDTLSAASLNVLKSAVESIPGWVKGTTTTDAVYMDGKVGIGTTSPNWPLHVVQSNVNSYIAKFEVNTSNTGGILLTDTSVAAGSKAKYIRSSAGNLEFGKDVDAENNKTTHMVIDVNGNVGIGTTNPQRSIHIERSPEGYIQFTNSDTGSTATDGTIVGLNTSEGYQIWNYENTYIRMGINGSEVARIDASGNLGLGTASPVSKFAVVGLPSGTNDSVVDGTLSGAVCISSSGNMYIDTDGSCAN